MSAVVQIARKAPAPEPTDRSSSAPASARPTPVRGVRAAVRVASGWGARASWAIERTGRAGIAGILLLLASAIFFASTHVRVAGEVAALRERVAASEHTVRAAPREAKAEPTGTRPALPARTEMPALLRRIFAHAAEAKLSVDSGKYEVSASAGGGVVRHHVVLPVSGPYARVRGFLDATLSTMPSVGLRDLALERRAVADGAVDAKIRLTVYTSATGPETTPAGGPAVAATTPGADTARVAGAQDAAALFATHSWHVIPVVALPPPPPPAPPSAPPFPYALLGSYAPDGASRVFFLAKGDRVVDAHVGDRIDGVYQFESADDAQLVFTYLPLDVRQTLAMGASR